MANSQEKSLKSETETMVKNILKLNLLAATGNALQLVMMPIKYLLSLLFH